MNLTALPLVLLLAALAPGPPQQDLQKTVQGFYTWVLAHHLEVAALEPKIVEVPGSTKFYLDTRTLRPFADRFVASGYFTPDFPQAVSRYYKKYEAQFAAMSKKEFDQIAKDGRGPLLETEDMDLFFCAQEYEYKKDFIDHLKLTSVAVHGDTATAEVESPYQWKTKFKFRKEGGRWLISGYCVYE